MKRSMAHNVGYLISLGLFIVAMVVLHYELKHYRFRDIVAELKAVRLAFLGLAVLLTFLDYWVLTAYDTLALRYIRHRLEYPKIAVASFIGYVFSHNMTIVGGSTARYRIYSALGVSAGEVAKLVIFCGLTFWLGFFAIGGVVFISESREIPAALHLPFATVKPIGMIFIAVVAAYLIVIALRRRPLTIREWEFTIPSFPISVGQIAIASLDWLLACGVLYALLPAAAKLTYIEFLGIFMLAQAAGLLSYVPGGLGVFEAVILLLLSDRVEKSSVLSCLVLYRLIYYLLPFAVATTLLAVYEMAAKKRSLQRFGVTFGKWGSAVTPHVLAAASFIAGVILLFSGALPATKGRITWLVELLPLPAMELSHFLGSLAGAGLLILARGLQRRVDAAYHLTVALLGLGIVLSLLKGLDYEEAIILAVMLLIFLPCHREFYRKASVISERLTPTWAILITAVLISSVWLGIFSHKHVEYSGQLWWRFAVNADAPRFMRATTGAAVLVLLYGVVRLLSPRVAGPLPTDPETMLAVEDIVRRSPKTCACLALLGDKSFLLSEGRSCFIMYGIEGRSWISMGDPVGSKQEWESLLWRYRELCDRHDGWPVFYQIESDNLDLYLDLGMTFLKLGEEGRVHLKDFSLEGSSRKGLRHAYNKIARENCSFSVVPCEQISDVLDQLKHISDAWLEEKNTREKGFSLGFFESAYIKKTPVAIVRKEGSIVAFANIWAGAEKEELSIDLMRHLPSAPGGIMDYLFVELMLWGRQQGYNWFNLGMAPMSGLEDRQLAPLWHRLGTFIFRHGEHFYNFQGLRQYKEKFDPLWESKYLACPRGLMLPRILANLETLISGGMKGVVAK
ncbi:MAG: bifunctional lysylphosphatidylglycerol flippase/synthetase MprF [Phycisphaerae bacterium]|nr:bifunctional lysylphosphatidylglycerol flippase/synthetase MprF [Phycisphaerae bacterium]